MKSKALEKQVADLEGKRESVAEAQGDADVKLRLARKAFSQGKGALSAVTTLQGETLALGGALADLDAELEVTREQLVQALTDEAKASNEQRARELDKEREQNATNYDARLLQIDSFLSTEIPALIAAQKKDGELHAEIRSLGGRTSEGLLAERRWSILPLRYARSIATMIIELNSEERRLRLKVASQETGKKNAEREREQRGKIVDRPQLMGPAPKEQVKQEGSFGFKSW